MISLLIIDFLGKRNLFAAHFFTHLLIVCLKGFFEYAAMRTKSWTGKGQECTHTRNGCEQSKHTSHPDIKRTRRSRSWDTHLTRRCVAGIGNIRKVEICTGISSGRLCIHRSKRRRRWPTIMPMGATIRKPLRPWDMSTGIVCGNGCWKRGRRRDRLVCRGEMS